MSGSIRVGLRHFARVLGRILIPPKGEYAGINVLGGYINMAQWPGVTVTEGVPTGPGQWPGMDVLADENSMGQWEGVIVIANNDEMIQWAGVTVEKGTV